MFSDLPEITVYPEAQTKTEGENVTLSCNVSGNPAPTLISWTRNGTAVNSSGRFNFSADKKQLTITNVDRKDSGEYQCVARNSLGSASSNAATLNVQCKCIVLCLSTKTEHDVKYAVTIVEKPLFSLFPFWIYIQYRKKVGRVDCILKNRFLC